MLIGPIDLAQRPMLIAEIGNNHEGDAALALDLADAAIESGADAVKVQVIDPSRLVNVSETARFAQLLRFRLPREVVSEISERVRRKGGLFMASVSDCPTLMAMQADLDAIKIASGDLDFDDMLETAARSGKPILLSTGMSSTDEVKLAVRVIARNLPDGIAVGDRLTVLHCVSLYPTPLEQANLAAIPRLARELGLTIGYSDHTVGIEASLIALSLGACVIEKHFTLDKKQSSFRDHALSAEPGELAQIARVVRSFSTILGTGERSEPLPDAETRSVARRSIVASRDLSVGTVLEKTDLDFVRPGSGLPPSEAAHFIGRRVTRNLAAHQIVQASDVE